MMYTAGIVASGTLTGQENREWLDTSIESVLETIHEYHAPVPKVITLHSNDGTFCFPFAQAISKRWGLSLCVHPDFAENFDTMGINFKTVRAPRTMEEFLRCFEKYILVTDGTDLSEPLAKRYFDQTLNLGACIEAPGVQKPREAFFLVDKTKCH